MRRLAPLSLLLLLPAAGCVQNPPVEEIGLWSDAAGDVQDLALAELCAESWELFLSLDPLRATWLGDPRYHGKLPDHSALGRQRADDELASLLERAQEIDGAALSDRDRITWEVLTAELEDRIVQREIDLRSWLLNPRSGPQSELLSIASVQPRETERQRAQLVERWSKIPWTLRETERRLRQGLDEGKVSSYTAVKKTLEQVEGLLATPTWDSPLMEPAMGGGHWVELEPGGSVAAIAHDVFGDARDQETLRRVNLHLQDGVHLVQGTRVLIPPTDDDLDPDVRGDFLFAVRTTIEDEVYPAFESYRDFLADVLLPATRDDDRCGMVHAPNGSADYRAQIRHHTTLDLTPSEIHAFGLEEVARIRAEIADVGERVFGTRDVAEIQRRLRTDPAMHFATREEVEVYAREAVARADAIAPTWFGRLPEVGCEVVPVPAHEERDTTIAYYRSPSADGSRPGRYYVNTYEPTTRPRYEAAVLAYHEAVPGHHTQLALAQELDGLPLFRRHDGATAFIEGWALYTERLCDEMGLFDSDVDRLGMLSFDAWRACRLVVDTGIHAEGWSRDRAIDYLYANTLLAANNVDNEVDRYIAWPGQALAYKIGQREILRLRSEAEAELGDAFSIASFHDRVLENASIPLPVLRRHVEAWIAAGG